MKNLLLSLLLSLSLATTAAYAQDAEEPTPSEVRAEQKNARREAADWVKKEMATRKKVISQLHKVKDDRSAGKAAKKLNKILNITSGEKTAMGEAGEERRPTGDAMDEEDKKKEPLVSKQKQQLDEELERIKELELDNEDLNEVLKHVEKLR